MLKFKRSLLFAGLLLAISVSAVFALIERYPLPGHRVFPEGIAAQASTGDFFVGSTTDGTVFRGNINSPQVNIFCRAAATVVPMCAA